MRCLVLIALARQHTQKQEKEGGREGGREGRREAYLEELLTTIHRVLQTGQGHGHVVPRDGASSLGVQEEAGAVGGDLYMERKEIVSLDLINLLGVSDSSKCPKKKTAIILFPRKTE